MSCTVLPCQLDTAVLFDRVPLILQPSKTWFSTISQFSPKLLFVNSASFSSSHDSPGSLMLARDFLTAGVDAALIRPLADIFQADFRH